LPVLEINLKACTPIIVKQFILPGLGIEPRPAADNRFRLSAHCASEPHRQELGLCAYMNANTFVKQESDDR